MNLRQILLVAILLARSSIAQAALPAKRYYDSHAYYAIEHIPGGASLDDIARALHVEVVEQVGELQDTWLVRRSKPQVAGRGEPDEDSDPVLRVFDDLRLRASSPIHSRSEDGLRAKEMVSSVKFLELQIPTQLVKRVPPPIPRPIQETASYVKERMGLKDPLFTKQWHLVNDELPEHDMNVTGVWNMGLTGKGVITSFIDDGVDFETEDLRDSFVPDFSYDFNDHVPLPRPVGDEDDHGTRCAGQVAARRNKACGIGIAYDVKAAGIRILGAKHISVVDEAAALNYGFQNVSIYSCSWGPRDDGKTMSGASYLIRKAVVNGVNHGRDGKGSIFVFASGNGAQYGDQCNFDGYTNSIYSVTVAAIDHKGLRPPYSEACAANMIVAYTSGSNKSIVTTDRGEGCTEDHGGTSAAAPNAVGVFALAMQARPDLTWRDIQHLCVNTARMVNPNDPDWQKMASGRMFSYKYGFGALDGYTFVTAAKSWKLVKPQAWLHTKPVQLDGGKMDKIGKKKYDYHGGSPITSSGVYSKIDITKDTLNDHNLEELEHIDVRVWIQHQRRGDVEVELISPSGIISKLAGVRQFDDNKHGFPGWRFMTLKHWGENPVGKWTLKVNDQGNSKYVGKFLGWNMALWGSAIDASKAKKFVEPVVDNTLPLTEDPDTPIVDETETNQHSKPTDHLPQDHGQASGENTKPVFAPSPSGTHQVDAEYNHTTKPFFSRKTIFVALCGVVVIGSVALICLWRRRVAKMAVYTSLPAHVDDIDMHTVGERSVVAHDGGPRTGRALYDSFNVNSTSDDLPRRDLNVNPPTGRALGFHTGFLDDDELSPGLTPAHLDEPNERGGRRSDDPVVSRPLQQS